MASAFSRESFDVATSDPEFCREVTLLIPTQESPERLCLLLDAEFYLEKLNAFEIVESLLATRQIPATAFAFVSNIDNAHRHVDYACNEAFSDFLTGNVVAEIRRRIPTLRKSGHVVGGLSLSGLAAAHSLSRHPDLFSAALCQSGSFWWNEESLTSRIDRLSGKLFYISVGNGETQSGLRHEPSGMKQDVPQLEACQRFAEKMERIGNRVRLEIFEGNHEMTPWAEELPEALRWLITENSRLS